MKKSFILFIIANFLVWGYLYSGISSKNNNKRSIAAAKQAAQNLSTEAKTRLPSNNKALLRQITALQSNNKGSGKSIILYDQMVGNLTNAQTDELWPSNNPRSRIQTAVMDGEIEKKYKVWENKYKSQVANAANQRGLEDNTDLTIYIKNLNINTAEFQDIRLFIDYLTSSGYTSLTHTYSFELYVIDTHNNRYGPYDIADFEPIGFYMRKNVTREIYERNFNLITENLKTPDNIIIKELEIKPYANFPRVLNAVTGPARDSRHADITTFELAGVKIIGYKDSFHSKPDYIKMQKINVDSTREKIVKRMYDIATIKWSPANDFHPLRSTNTNYLVTNTTYQKDKIYYGMPYTQRNKVPLEKFANEIKNGILSKPEESLKIWGVDCAGSVSYSISKYIPMHVIYNSEDFIWERNKTTLLGNLSINGNDASAEILKSRYSEQEIYEAYAELQKGDIVATHNKKNSHVMIVSGNSIVCRNNNGIIDPDTSYFYRTDISMRPVDTAKSTENYGGQTNPADVTVPFEPKTNYTDIKNLNELKGKNLNFYINKKMTFKEAYNKNYVPITLNAYLTETIEKPYAKIINANTAQNIKEGLKGTIISNYTILNVRFDIKNNKTGEKKTFIDYPNHNRYSLEGKYGNTYSLYYNTPRYIKNYLQNTLKDCNNFEIIISIAAGEKTRMEALNIKT